MVSVNYLKRDEGGKLPGVLDEAMFISPATPHPQPRGHNVTNPSGATAFTLPAPGGPEGQETPLSKVISLHIPPGPRILP